LTRSVCRNMAGAILRLASSPDFQLPPSPPVIRNDLVFLETVWVVARWRAAGWDAEASPAPASPVRAVATDPGARRFHTTRKRSVVHASFRTRIRKQSIIKYVGLQNIDASGMSSFICLSADFFQLSKTLALLRR